MKTGIGNLCWKDSDGITTVVQSDLGIPALRQVPNPVLIGLNKE